MKCILCGKVIAPKGTWVLGNNAMPLAAGRCCDMCNANKVIPARLGIKLEDDGK